MREPSSHSDALWPLLDSVFDDNLTDSEVQKLETLLTSDPEVRLLFFHHVQLRSNIRFLCRAEKACEKSMDYVQATRQLPLSHGGAPILHLSLLDCPTVAAEGVSSWLMAYLMAAVMVGIGIAVMAVVPAARSTQFAALAKSGVKQQQELAASKEERGVGRIAATADCVWANPETAVRQNDTVAFGQRISLISGLLEIAYHTGARVILQGPATYDVQSRNAGFLSQGSLVGRVDGIAAKGFAIQTPTAIVTDLGTEFGVEVNSKDSVVQILAGEIDLTNRTTGKTMRLRAGTDEKKQMVRIDISGKVTPCAPQEKPRFVRKMTQTPRESRFDSSSEGWTVTLDGRSVEHLIGSDAHGGYIETIDGGSRLGGERWEFFFVAPDRFHGDVSEAFDGWLQFDVRPHNISAQRSVQLSSSVDVTIRSKDILLGCRLPDRPKIDQWNTYNIPLNESGGWLRLDPEQFDVWRRQKIRSSPATIDDIQHALKHVNGLFIRGEYLGTADSTRLDNVRIVPPSR